MNTLAPLRDFLAASTITFQWDRIQEFLTVLEPLYSITLKMQKEKYTAGDLCADLRAAHSKLNRITEYRDSAEDMSALLHNRTDPLINSIQFQAALYMDPRFVHQLRTEGKETWNQTIVSIFLLLNYYLIA